MKNPQRAGSRVKHREEEDCKSLETAPGYAGTESFGTEVITALLTADQASAKPCAAPLHHQPHQAAGETPAELQPLVLGTLRYQLHTAKQGSEPQLQGSEAAQRHRGCGRVLEVPGAATAAGNPSTGHLRAQLHAAAGWAAAAPGSAEVAPS